MLSNRRVVWALVVLLGFLIAVNLVLVVAVFWVAGLDRREMYRDEIRKDLGTAITNVVDRIIEDVGLRQISAAQSADDAGKSDKDDEGRIISADVATVNRAVWLNGQRFELGDIIAPYGVITEVGHNVVVVVDLDGVRRLIARPVPPLPVASADASGGKSETKAKAAGNASGTMPAPVAGA